MSRNNTDYTVSVEELLELIDSLDVRFDKDTMTPYVGFFGKDDEHNGGVMEMM